MDIINNTYKRVDNRGTFLECLNSDVSWKSINSVTMEKGAIVGNHYHKKCRVCFFLIYGLVEILVKNVRQKGSETERLTLHKDEGVIFEPYETHAGMLLKDSSFLIIKSEKYSEDNKDLYEAKLTY